MLPLRVFRESANPGPGDVKGTFSSMRPEPFTVGDETGIAAEG